MSASGWVLLVAVVGAAASVLAAYIGQRASGRKAKTDLVQQIIDQLQEERAAEQTKHHEEIAAVRHELAEVKGEAQAARREVEDVKARMEGRERVLLDYAASLRAHIDQRREPPPPPWPSALMRHT